MNKGQEDDFHSDSEHSNSDVSEDEHEEELTTNPLVYTEPLTLKAGERLSAENTAAFFRKLADSDGQMFLSGYWSMDSLRLVLKAKGYDW